MKHARHALFTLSTLALAVTAAHAADDVYELDASVVSASGHEQDMREAPASVSVVTEKELETKPVADIGDAVGDVPGVDISTTKMGNAQVNIRGFDAKYTLVLVDGRRQNVSDGMMDNGFNPTSVFMPPPGAVERIEVIRGPASTVYGSDAVGGVVNIITKKHVDRFTGRVGVEGTLFESSDYGNRFGSSVYLGVPLKKDVASLQLRARYLTRSASEMMKPGATAGQNPYGAHASTEGFTGNLGARLTLSVTEDDDIYVDGDYTRFKGGSMNTSGKSIRAVRWYDKVNAVAGARGESALGKYDAYLQYNALSMIRTSSSGANLSYPGTVTEGSFSDPLAASRNYEGAVKLSTPFELGSMGNLMLSTGLNVAYETFVDNTTDAPIRGKTLDQTTASAYGEGEWFVTDEWIATAGARVQWSDIFGAHAAPRAFLVYKPVESLSFKGGVAAGYKTPAVKQLTDGIYAYDGKGSAQYNVYGDPNLKPEESWSYEFSATWDAGRVAQVTAGVFYTDFKNQLDVVEISDTDMKAINHGKVRAQGVELLLKTAPLWGVRFTGGYTLTDAEIRSGESRGERPNSLPRHSLTARFDYERDNFSAYLKSVSKFDSAIVSTKGTPAGEKYRNLTLVDLGATYTYAKRHTFSVALNNLFDEGFAWVPGRSAGSWANAYAEYVDGRNLWLSYAYSF